MSNWWYLAKSLDTLRKQVNTLFPNRDLKSEGTIGDAKHAARKSSHNPDERGAVRAWDCTHNLTKGVDCRQLLKALLTNPDPRIWYIIFEGKIYNRKDGFKPRPYSGINAHRHHLHISVSDDPKLYDDAKEWKLDFTPTTPQTIVVGSSIAQQKPVTIPDGEIGRGAKGENVRLIQLALVRKGYLKDSDIDSVFGLRTEQALQRFQKDNSLVADGIYGNRTKQFLFK